MLLSFSDSLSGLFFALLGVYLFFASSATKLHFFLGVFLHFITGADSQTFPSQSGGQFITALANDKQYASYVNDGHEVDKHFVPGLYVDDKGVLSYDPARDVGFIVGTKTTYVDGLYMKEAGVEKYKEVAEKELDKLAKEMFQ